VALGVVSRKIVRGAVPASAVWAPPVVGAGSAQWRIDKTRRTRARACVSHPDSGTAGPVELAHPAQQVRQPHDLCDGAAVV